LGLTSDARFGVIALDEGIGSDEILNPMIADRLAFRLDLSLLSPSQDFEALFTPDDLERARSRLSSVVISDAMIEALCAAQLSLAIDSARAGLLAVKTAISLAAIAGRDQVLDSDAALAAELVLAPRARAVPADQSEPETSQDDDPPDQPDDPQDPPPESAEDQQPDLTDLILDAVRAVLPADLLTQLQDQGRAPKSGQGGRAGLLRKVKHRGRATGSRPGTLGGGARLNVIDTLRAAAPWQRIRRQNHVSQTARRIFITKSDFRITNFKQRSETATIFVVDASGSSALNRLAEAKGAVELLLADCYARRDVVAVISFRGRAPEILLPPTRSLVRAKRGLAGLPGGGGTPLASAIDAAGELAQAIRRKGQVPAIIFLTDGRANIARDGAQGRAGADADAMIAARQLRESGLKTLLIDTSPRPQEEGARIAQAMGARYLALPFANAQALSAAARQIIDAPPGATR
jgi:magnesium chelatase subunit D